MNMIVLMNSTLQELGIGLKQTYNTKEILNLESYLLVMQVLFMFLWQNNIALRPYSPWIIS